MAYKAINLMIGTACDMRCAYCLQTGADIPANHKADLVSFSEKFIPFLHSSGIPSRIIFWGGEPMLYWETIKSIMQSLEKADSCPTEGFFITTNGRRMTDEYVEYANAHHVWTTVSAHDWGFTREQMDRIFRLDHFSISSIIEHRQIEFWDLRKRFYELEDRYGFKPRLYLHYLRANDGCSPDCYLTKDDVDKLVEHLVFDVINLACRGDDWARWQCAQLLSERRKELAKGEGSKCVREDRLSIDLHGNTYRCHHNYDASNISGNIFKKTIPIVEQPLIDCKRFEDSPECRNCSIFSECRGGCYLSNTHEVDCYLAQMMSKVYALMEQIPGLHV